MPKQGKINRHKLKILIIVSLTVLTACSVNSKSRLEQYNEGKSDNSITQTFDKKNDLNKLKSNMISLISPSVYAQQFVNKNIFTLNRDSTIDELNLIKDELNNKFYSEWKTLIDEKNTAVSNLKEIVADKKLSGVLFAQTDSVEEKNEEIFNQLKDIQNQEQLSSFVANLENTYFSYDTTMNLLTAELKYLPDDLEYTEYESQRIVVQTYSKALHKYGKQSSAEKFDKENLID